MSIKGGPHIETSGLVLYYDVDNVDSYPGEPTTNLATDSLTPGGCSGAWSLVDSDTKTFLTDVRYTSVHNPWRSYYYSIAGQAGNTVTITCDYEVISEVSGSLNAFYLGQGNTGTYPNYIPGSGASNYSSTTSNGPQRLTWTGVINAAEYIGWTMTGTGLTSGGIVTIQISNWQVEVKSHATPFVNGTRSTTDGMKDLSGNNTDGDFVNDSFDSSAEITYDGTGWINMGNPSSCQVGANGTVEAWVYPTANNWMYFLEKGYASNNGLYLGHHSSYSTAWWFGTYDGGYKYMQWGAGTFELNKWHNVAITFDGALSSANFKLYHNGIYITSYSWTSDIMTNSSDITIGNRVGSGRGWHGKVDIIKISDVTLSAQKLLNNFNALKGRFGL